MHLQYLLVPSRNKFSPKSDQESSERLHRRSCRGFQVRMKQIAILTNELPPYRRPIFELLGQQNGLDVRIYLSTRKEPHRLWDLAGDLPHAKVQTIPNIAINARDKRRDRLIHFPVGALPILLRNRPDAVISGEFGFRTLMAWLYCVTFRKPLIIWSGETTDGAATASTAQRLIRRFLTRRATGFLAYGEAARRYLHHLGANDEKISILAQSVDNEYWRSAVHAANTELALNRHEIVGHVVLCVGNLLYPKGIHHLIQAWANLPEQLQQGNTLLLVGDGSERDRLQALAAELRAQNVVFAGPIAHHEIAAYYALAHFLVLPTLLDVWGLVVNEAMASGVPVLCSRYAGCAEELIIPGETGDVFDPEDTIAFSDLLRKWLQRPTTPPNSVLQEHIQHWSFSRSVSGIIERLEKVGIPLSSSDESRQSR